MQREYLDYFAKFIERELGIVFSPENYFQLQGRLESVATQLAYPGVKELYDTVSKGNVDKAAKQALLDCATNNETYFFATPRSLARSKARSSLVFLSKSARKNCACGRLPRALAKKPTRSP